MTKEEELKIAVYGTLRKGLINNLYYLAGRDPIDTIKIHNFKLYDLGPFPAIVPTKDKINYVIAEVYLVPEKLYSLIKAMEENAGYKTVNIATKESPLFLWVMDDVADRMKHVKHGDYKRYIEEKYKVYNDETKV